MPNNTGFLLPTNFRIDSALAEQICNQIPTTDIKKRNLLQNLLNIIRQEINNNEAIIKQRNEIVLFNELCNEYTKCSLEKITQKVNKLCPRQNSDIEEQQKHRKNYLGFIGYSLLLLMREVISGMAGVYELLQYSSSLLNFHILAPVAIGISIFFGFVSCSVTAAFDVKAVADYMGISYLTSKKTLTILLDEARKLRTLITQIELEINNLSSHKIRSSTIQKERILLKKYKKLDSTFNKIQNSQILVCHRLEVFQTAFENTRKKRMVCKVIWTFFAAILYAGIANLTALTAIGMLASFTLTPLSSAVLTAVTLIWIATELYRFLRLENHFMKNGVDALFGSPISITKKAGKIKKELGDNVISVKNRIKENIVKVTLMLHVQKQNQNLFLFSTKSSKNQNRSKKNTYRLA